MEKIIAYCGINCSECLAYLATQKGNLEEIETVAKEWSTSALSFKSEDIYCDGCNQEGRIFTWCSECPIKICCQEKGLKNCAHCEDYFCDKLKITFDKVPLAKECLDKIRKNL
jgi:hypothetical protein